MQPPSLYELHAIAAMRANDTIPTKVAVLLLLLGQNGEALQVGEIGRRLGLKLPVVSMTGDALRRDGSIERVCPAHDQRKTSFALTDMGRRRAEKHLKLLRAISGCAGAGPSE